jgi:SAM-dependent methyltransferase
VGEHLNIVTPLHLATSRDYISRMMDEKVHCMHVAQEYGKDYWDGDRRYGYGGYKYLPGRWEPVARELINRYSLTNRSTVLDVGCGKGFLLFELHQLLPEMKLLGFDISTHGLSEARPEIQNSLFLQSAEEKYPLDDKSVDLVISLGCLHNLTLLGLEKALSEIERVGHQNYIMVESYRTNEELFNLQCWALTAQSFFTPAEWIWIFERMSYTGDYEFIFFS